MNNKYFKYFLFFLIGITLARLSILSSFNLVPQEAYYWLYTKHPALSYFDHPPACSHTIWVFTHIFGDSEFAVRIGMLLYSVGTALFLFFLSKDYFSSVDKAFQTILFLNLTIFFNLHSIVATPDAPLLFFWSGAMYFYFKAIFFGDRWKHWILGGIFSGFALLSKYTAVFIFFNLALYLIWRKQWQKIFSYKFIASVVFALIVFSPVII
ncbi:MAG: glycosyltransferase family 39 protein, partial [Candidatus Kapaibacteriota bacterium]